MAAAVTSFDVAMRERSISHDAGPVLSRHIANARRHDLKRIDEHGKPLWSIRKERSDSPKKIDAAVAGVLSWKARKDAIAAGVSTESVMKSRLVGV